MANSLHFVRDKEPVLRRLCDLLQPDGRLVIIEYNTRRGNGAVPYPLDDAAFLSLAARIGLVSTGGSRRAPSSFLGEMYTGVAVRPQPIAPATTLLSVSALSPHVRPADCAGSSVYRALWRLAHSD